MTSSTDAAIQLGSDDELLEYCQLARKKVAVRLLDSSCVKEVNTALKAIDGITTTILRRDANNNEKQANDITDRALRAHLSSQKLYNTDPTTIDAKPREVSGRQDRYDPTFTPTESLMTPVGTSLSYETFSLEQEGKLKKENLDE